MIIKQIPRGMAKTTSGEFISEVIERYGAVNEYKEACEGDFQTKKKTHTDLRTRKICMGKVYGLLSNNVNKRCLALIHVSATEQHC